MNTLHHSTRVVLTSLLSLMIVAGYAGAVTPIQQTPPTPQITPTPLTCPDAAPTQLTMGLAVVVAEGIGPLNLRALPAVSTGIVRQLYQNTPLTVIGGPSCNDIYRWWRVETEDGRAGWIAEGSLEEYYIVPADPTAAAATLSALTITPTHTPTLSPDLAPAATAEIEVPAAAGTGTIPPTIRATPSATRSRDL
ncbi:MAG: SH3 domain-containing protein [Chloroflexi bacterium]|nr:SH3 domain-containing protein [Chloroflexota bacterium]